MNVGRFQVRQDISHLGLDIASPNLNIEEHQEPVLAGEIEVAKDRPFVEKLQVQAVLASLRLRRCVHDVERRLHAARPVQLVVPRRVLPYPCDKLVRLELAEDAHSRHVRVAVVREYLVRGQKIRVH